MPRYFVISIFRASLLPGSNYQGKVMSFGGSQDSIVGANWTANVRHTAALPTAVTSRVWHRAIKHTEVLNQFYIPRVHDTA